ncbi:uncharacterized protein LOC143208786 [Lasioglossum baleicum]|uniref:uncharacterized protein LOC143208786 n=1 Tax=Lasioglossum baleicum TaxID=434251 RepID=UPI003FCECF87
MSLHIRTKVDVSISVLTQRDAVLSRVSRGRVVNRFKKREKQKEKQRERDRDRERTIKSIGGELEGLNQWMTGCWNDPQSITKKIRSLPINFDILSFRFCPEVAFDFLGTERGSDGVV